MTVRMFLVVSSLIVFSISSTFTPTTSSHAQFKERLKLVVFLDKSESMKEELPLVADLSERIIEKLDQRCAEYSIAVSELEYGDIQSDPVGIIGNPAFITEEHPNPAEALRERILAYLPTSQNCIQPRPGGCVSKSANHVGTLEYTYSSIVTTFQKNKLEIFNEPIRHLATLLITDAAPLFEPYTVDEALDHINSFISLDKFSATTLSHENWNNPFDQSCTMDFSSRVKYTIHDLQSLKRFSQLTQGSSFNICDSRSQSFKQRLKWQIESFINEVILKSCLLIS